MKETILNYILEGSFVLFSAGLTFIYKSLKNNTKITKSLMEAQKYYMQERLEEKIQEAMERGFERIDCKRRTEKIYKSYKLLGGNGAMTKLYDDYMDLPINKRNGN